MNRPQLRFLVLTALLGILAGCVKEYTNPQLDDRAAGNSWMVNTYFQDQVEAAIITESTIYPHHFVAHSAKLNELGHRDVLVLGRHFRENPGRLTVRRGPAAEELYAQRLSTVRTAMAAHGVDADRMTLDDGFPGGDGIRSERALIVMERDIEPLSAEDGGFSASGTGAGGQGGDN